MIYVSAYRNIGYWFQPSTDSEKAATVHKSKYDFMLGQEERRLQRNRELLHMLEDIDTRASTLAARTERLKQLKVRTNEGSAFDKFPPA